MNTYITLQIANPRQLPKGYALEHCFDRRGGTVGANHQCDWSLRGIRPLHCEVRWRDGCFCVVDRCGHTYMNHASQPLPTGLWVRLGSDDCLGIGGYQVSLHLGDNRQRPPSSLLELLNGHQCPLQALASPLKKATRAPAATADERDPLALLDARARHARPDCAVTQILQQRVPAVTQTIPPSEAP